MLTCSGNVVETLLAADYAADDDGSDGRNGNNPDARLLSIPELWCCMCLFFTSLALSFV